MGTAALITALVPFIWFAGRILEFNIAERGQASFLASLVKTGPVTKYPDVLVVRGGFFPEEYAAILMLDRGFQQVDVIDTHGFKYAGATLAIAPTDGCEQVLRAWHINGGVGLNPSRKRCLTTSIWDRIDSVDRNSAIVLLQDQYTMRKQNRNSTYDLELRIKDGREDALIDYWAESNFDLDRPVFPLFVSWTGFVPSKLMDASRVGRGHSPVEFLLSNLARH